MVTFLGKFTQTGNAGNCTANWIISGGNGAAGLVPGVVSGTNVSGALQFTAPGVYLIKLHVVDGAGTAAETDLVSNDLPAFVVIYDPNGGFVTGGGWINSPAGAFHPELAADAGVIGKASFGFVAKYLKGANVPTGNTEFQFKAGNLNFKSTAYQWLVVAGAKAQYKGQGTINGQGSFGFMLTAIDGALKGSGQPDRFRMKISDQATGIVIYDNQAGAADFAELDTGTVIGGGSIVIHDPKK